MADMQSPEVEMTLVHISGPRSDGRLCILLKYVILEVVITTTWSQVEDFLWLSV